MFSLSAPVRAPVLVTAHSSNSTSMTVKWSHLLRKDFQGKPIGYEINYHPVSSQLDIYSLRVNHTSNATTLTNLTVYTMYVIYVSAVSSGGIGPANTARARTGAEGKEVLKWP